MRNAPILLVLLLVWACSEPFQPRGRAGKSGRYYGGVLSANETEELRGFFPLGLVQAASHRIAAQVYEGLVSLDPKDLTIVPRLAESWDVAQGGTVYTFRLRKGVYFHDDACFPDGRGRELTAHDVVACFTALCTHDETNKMFWLFQDRVLGANAHYVATAQGQPAGVVKGIEEVDEHTVRITLTGPWSGFLHVLAHQGCWIYPPELRAHHGAAARWHMVGTGPFRVAAFRPGEVMVLERFARYWGKDEHGEPLPYLDAIRYTFEKDKDREVEEFIKGNLSVIYELPVDRTDLLSTTDDRYQVQTTAGLTIQFYGFNSQRPPLNDPRVRRAFSLAVDRQWLVDSVLAGLAVPASHGVVPPGFADYPYDSVPTLRHDPAEARRLLEEAGYPEGRGLPTVFLQLNSGFGYVEVASAVQSMLERNLGVRVVTTVLPADQHYERVERGQAQFWREGWIADHPDPENFLAMFHGRNVPADTSAPSMNSTRYRSARFDSLFAAAQRTDVTLERMRTLALAERCLMEDAVVMPLYHERSVRLLQTWVRDLPINGMEYRDLRTVWFDPVLWAGR